MKMVDVAEHADIAAAVSGHRRGGDRSRHAADPQSGHGRRQSQSAAALLVLPQRGVRLLEEGRERPASRSPARTSSTRSSAAARASSSIRRAWRCRCSPTAPRSASSGPKGERMVPAAEYFTLPRENVRKENVLEPDELLTHVILPAPGNVKSGHYEVRYKTSHDWPIAFATVLLTMNGSTVRSARVVMGAVAPIPWRSHGGRAGAGRQDDHRGDRGRRGRGRPARTRGRSARTPTRSRSRRPP